MATKLMHPPIQVQATHLLKQKPKIKMTISTPAPICTHSGFIHCPFGSRSRPALIRAASVQDPKDTIALTKSTIYHALQGINRGVFGMTSTKRSEIGDLVMQLEAQNPTPNPILNLEKVSGSWKLIYSTITILGPKRTKLGLRDFVTLGDFLQIIDVTQGKAVNIIKFSARGLSLLNGQLTIQASFTVASSSRVNIKYDTSHITPDQLMNLFKKNYELLLNIFNPEGWLDITYVDETMRIGRDDKGNIFILERSMDNNDQL